MDEDAVGIRSRHRTSSAFDGRRTSEIVSGMSEWIAFLDSTEAKLSKPDGVAVVLQMIRQKRDEIRRAILEGSQSTQSAIVDPATDVEPLDVQSSGSRSVYTTNIDLDIMSQFEFRTEPSSASPAAKNAGKSAAVPSGLIDAFKRAALDSSQQSTPRLTATESAISMPGSGIGTMSSGIGAMGSGIEAGPNDVVALQPVKSNGRGFNFNSSFPIWRKLFHHSTQSRTLLRSKSKKYSSRFSSAISPDLKHFVLVSPANYQVYGIPADYNDPPILKFSGDTPNSVDVEGNEEHYFVAANNTWAVIAATSGTLIVVSLSTGNVIYRNSLQFYIQALDLTQSGSYIAVAIVGASRATKRKQPMVMLLSPNNALSEEACFKHVDTITFSSPYSDLIKTISIAPDEMALVCGTDKESRFFAVSLEDPREPRILFRSSRKASTDADAEGITDLAYFPNTRYLVVTSVAANAAPVVLEARTPSLGQRRGSSSTTSANGPGPLSVAMRVDKVGSTIHKAVTSPDGNALALVDKSGCVYVLHIPRMSMNVRKIAVCFEVTGAPTKFKAAAIRFSQDGTVLMAVDRKGILQIADYGAGAPSAVGMSKSRLLA